MSDPSAAAIQLRETWDLFEKNCNLTLKNLSQLQEAFTKALIQIERLTLSRQNWRIRAENAEARLKEISSC